VRHFRSVVILLTLTLAFAGSAFADTVNMSFTGPGGNNSGGVYTYPYNFAVTPGGTVALICDAFDNEVVSGETWTATVNTLTGGNGLFASQANSLNNYKAAGLIFEGIVNGSITDTNAANWAIWGLFSADATTTAYYQSSGAAALAAWYQLVAFFTPNSAFDSLVLYTPIAGTQSGNNGLPQEYIGIKVPEPAEIALMLMMIIGSVLGFAFRQRLGLKLAVAQQA